MSSELLTTIKFSAADRNEPAAWPDGREGVGSILGLLPGGPFPVDSFFDSSLDRRVGAIGLAAKKRKPPRPLSEEAAVATWAPRRLRRIRQLKAHDISQLAYSAKCLSVRHGLLYHGQSRAPVRPSTGAMLRRFIQEPQAVVPLAEIGHCVYGRPASIRAVRQIVFRVNRAFENVGCPVFAYCHAAKVFLRPRTRSFERTSATATSVGKDI